jgi:BirA family biotin operon repressor/biotin-[acetyl-CoA-carboxylase] ligase
MDDTILDFLKKKQGYVSGEELSARLNISRQALWKHIQEFKEAGYEILAVPHLGYKLTACPDRLFASEISRGLQTKIIAKKICYFAELASTMDAAAALGMQGAGEGTLVVAESQTKGRGRLGRSWISPRHKGIYFSLILRPRITPAQAPVLTLVTAVSICDAIRKVTGVEAKIKWPNDIMISGKKLGGILTELSAEMDAVRFVIIGVGLNVNNTKVVPLATATSLREQTGAAVSRVELLQEILRAIERRYLAQGEGENQAILQAARQASNTLGGRVKVVTQGYTVEGHAVDLDKDGALLVRNDAGLIQKVTSGDVILSRSETPP